MTDNEILARLTAAERRARRAHSISVATVAALLVTLMASFQGRGGSVRFDVVEAKEFRVLTRRSLREVARFASTYENGATLWLKGLTPTEDSDAAARINVTAQADRSRVVLSGTSSYLHGNSASGLFTLLADGDDASARLEKHPTNWTMTGVEGRSASIELSVTDSDSQVELRADPDAALADPLPGVARLVARIDGTSGFESEATAEQASTPSDAASGKE